MDFRLIRCADDELWFVAKGACNGVELANSRDAIASLDDDEKADVVISSNSVTQN